MADHCDNIKTIIDALPLGITSYIHDLPEDLNQISITLSDNQPSPLHTMGAQAPSIERINIEIVCTHTTPATCFSIAQAIKTALDGKTNFTVSGTKYISCLAITNIDDLGYDKRRRKGFAIDFQLLINNS